MNPESNVDILLATYNGGMYLNQQIDSILAQNCKDFRLLIRDDSSSDNTINIIKNYISKHPDKIQLIIDSKGHLGLAQNFAALLELAQSKYIMFCDQDDVWLPDKIQLSLNTMKTAESNSPNLPLLVHSDLRVVDKDLILIADSLWHLLGIDSPACDSLNNLIVRNPVTGCTIMINCKARDISLPIPQEAPIHDWWIAMNVAKLGKIIRIPSPTILYRQHSGNVISAGKKKPYRLSDYKNRIINQYNVVKKVVPDTNPVILIARILVSEIARKTKTKNPGISG
jgi:glycosyltransferase involved in cell wall biosynthesis